MGNVTPRFADALRLLKEGVNRLIQEFQKLPKLKSTHYFVEIEDLKSFLDTLSLIWDTMPKERLHETLRNAVKAIRKTFQKIPKFLSAEIATLNVDSTGTIPDFLCQVFQLIGPTVRISANEMIAWVYLEPDEAIFFTPETLLTSLQRIGIVAGIQESNLRDLFTHSLFGKEIPIARGKNPEPGQDAMIEYIAKLDDLGYTPKVLVDGKLSYKDICLFLYVSAGDTIARKIPPIPGNPGYTVTNRIIPPLEPNDVDFPEIDCTYLSKDETRLIAEADACITKKNGRIFVRPTMKIQGDVSFGTGNINSKVSVVVEHDIITGFSVVSEKDVLVQGTVEGARIESKGDIVVNGGIRGGEKALVESNGQVTAKYITHARVNCLGNITAATEILHSRLETGGRVMVTGVPGHILGGEINADADVVANQIGSEVGVKTVIRLGGRTQELVALLLETQEKIAEQEEITDKCRQIIDTLKMQSTRFPTPPADITQAITKTGEMLATARQNLEQFNAQNDSLQTQYEESVKQSRTVRARQNIMPGTTIQIQEAELTIQEPTGPVTVVKQGDQLVCLPFKEIEEEK